MIEILYDLLFFAIVFIVPFALVVWLATRR